MATGRVSVERQVIRVGGAEARGFLNDLVTTDVEGLAAGVARYGALLTPQGKYISDFVMVGGEDAVLLDVAAGQAAALAQRLVMYRLRRKIEIAAVDLAVVQVWGIGAEAAARAAGGLAVPDPRDAALGWRVYAADGDAALAASGAAPVSRADWDALRVAHMAPEPDSELTPESYVLEYGFDRLNGVDFRKGCYVGQEIVARMKHKTELRKGLARVRVTGPAPAPGTEILTEDGKVAGVLGAVAGDMALAHLRFDRAVGPMRAGDAVITRD
jgi:folate-binding protein YgfZ